MGIQSQSRLRRKKGQPVVEGPQTTNPPSPSGPPRKGKRTKSRKPANTQVELLGSFGARPQRTPAELYIRNFFGSGMGGSATGAVTNKKELGLTVTDFFNYSSVDPAAGGVPQFVTNYFWDINQNLFNDTVPGDETETFCRVRKLCVWVLPQKGILTSGDIDSSNATAMYTVNCQVPGVPSIATQQGGIREAYATNTQVTNILPQIDTRWKKVFSCNLQKTFQSGVVRPFFTGGPGQPGYGTQQCLFQMSIVNSTDGSPYYSTSDDPDGIQGIRVKVQLLVDQPILPEQAAKFGIFRNEEFSAPDTVQNGSPYPGVSEQYVQMNLRSILDNFA